MERTIDYDRYGLVIAYLAQATYWSTVIMAVDDLRCSCAFDEPFRGIHLGTKHGDNRPLGIICEFMS